MTARDRTVLVVLAVCAILAGVWFGLVGPRRGEVAQLRDQTTAARQQYDTLVSQVAQGRAAKRAHARGQALIARLGKALPTVDDSASLLYQLQDAAGRSRVSITALTPVDATGPAPATATPTAVVPPGVEAQTITMNFEGSYLELQRFLSRIQHFAEIDGRRVAVRGRLISVQSVDLKQADVAGAPLQASVQALTYSASATPAAAAPGSAGVVAGAPGAPATSAVPPTTPATIGAGG